MTFIAFLLATIIAAILGTIVVTIVYRIASADDGMGDFDGLGSLFSSFFAGFAVTVTAYVAAACVIVRALLPNGQRAIPIVAVIVVPPVALISFAFVAAFAGSI